MRRANTTGQTGAARRLVGVAFIYPFASKMLAPPPVRAASKKGFTSAASRREVCTSTAVDSSAGHVDSPGREKSPPIQKIQIPPHFTHPLACLRG